MYVHLVDMLRLFVSRPLENITVSRNSEVFEGGT